MRTVIIRRCLATFIERSRPVPRNKVVRVRFAPSPTGYLHLGGLRTAFYNLLFARCNGGQFILRIEDTDQARVVPGAIEQLERDLEWAGVVLDEGPSAGGAYGPYIQSQRRHLYNTQAQILVDQDAAYPCFCSEKRLELLRKEALRLRQVPKYDNKCRALSKEEAQSKIQQGHPHCIRFKLSPLDSPIPDLICGESTYQPCENEGDPVIMKQDGYPTYHLANVVDDHMMVVTHVLRGEEWFISTPKHVLLYKAFGWDAPQYAHLPLILNHDGSKLSKRQNDIRVESYQQKGIMPLALMNFITKAGGGFKNLDQDTIYSMDELSKKFDLSLVHKNSCKLTERLGEYNQVVLKQMTSDERSLQEMIELVISKVTAAFPDSSDLDLSNDHVRKIICWSLNRVKTLCELAEPKMAYLWVMPSETVLLHSSLKLDHIKLVLEELEKHQDDLAGEHLKLLLKNVSEENKVSFSKLMMSLRAALSGLKEGPSVVELMEILGKDTVQKRLKRVMLVRSEKSVQQKLN